MDAGDDAFGEFDLEPVGDEAELVWWCPHCLLPSTVGVASTLARDLTHHVGAVLVCVRCERPLPTPAGERFDAGRMVSRPSNPMDDAMRDGASKDDWCPRCDMRIDMCPPADHRHSFAWDIVASLADGFDGLEAWCDTARLRSADTVGWKRLMGFTHHAQDHARRVFRWDGGVMATTQDDLVPVRW